MKDLHIWQIVNENMYIFTKNIVKIWQKQKHHAFTWRSCLVYRSFKEMSYKRMRIKTKNPLPAQSKSGNIHSPPVMEQTGIDHTDSATGCHFRPYSFASHGFPCFAFVILYKHYILFRDGCQVLIQNLHLKTWKIYIFDNLWTNICIFLPIDFKKTMTIRCVYPLKTNMDRKFISLLSCLLPLRDILPQRFLHICIINTQSSKNYGQNNKKVV